MTNKAKKKKVVVNLYGHQSQIDKQYSGRLLGLITSEEFNALIKNKSLQTKFLTSETVGIKEINDNYSELNGLRIVVAVKKIGDTEVTKQLFVSEPLNMINYFYSQKNEMGLITDEDNLITIAQDEVD